MIGGARRIVIVSSRYPFGSQETYLGTELGELVNYFERIAVVPVRAPEGIAHLRLPVGVEILAWPLCNAELLRRAAQAPAPRPAPAATAISHAFCSPPPRPN